MIPSLTEHFIVLEPLSSSIDEHHVVKKFLQMDFKALKFPNVPSGTFLSNLSPPEHTYFPIFF